MWAGTGQKLLVAALIVFAHGGAQAWTYNYSTGPNQRWLEARQWCQKHFTDMVGIQNREETEFLDKLLPSNPKYYWIGIHKVAGAWTWAGSNQNVPEEAQNWATSEPDNITGQDCVEIYIKRKTDSAKWNNEKCRNKKGTVCYADSCMQDSCSAHADCVETVGSFTCRCHPGFFGPRCEEATACTPLPDPAHGFQRCFHPFGSSRFNSSCLFGCELGFRLVGESRLLCRAGGRWSRAAPLCQAEQCPVLNHTSFSGGGMTCSHPVAPYSYNSTCEFRCDDGYQLTGDARMHCDHSGQWTASIPACTVIKCPAIVSPATGNVTCVDAVEPFSFGSRCDLTCREGFYLTGDEALICLASGRWSRATPTCTAVQCGRLKPPLHAHVQCKDPAAEHSYGSTCTVHCEDGFDLIGANVTTCSAQGTWSHALPGCRAKTCDPVQSPRHGSLSCSDPNASFSFGSRCTETCDEGFLLNGTSSFECTSQGRWSADMPSCLAQRCPTLNSTAHGSFICSHPHGEFSFGSRCTSTCEDGFRLNGTAETECTSAGTWSTDMPHCSAQRCPTLQSPPHGSLTCSKPHGEFSFGSQCKISCDEGFVLNGTSDTECTSAGTWSDDVPPCSAQTCPALSAPSHGSLICSDPHGEFSFGSRCTSTCEEGFLPTGTADTNCTSEGRWSREMPRCQARQCPLLAEAPRHGRMTCSHPDSPFSYGSVCSFECSEGFRLRGAPAMTCNASGLWSQTPAGCQPVQCAALRASSSSLSMNCSHPLGNFSFGSQCAFACEEGSSLNGSSVLLCSPAGLWNDSAPSCIGMSMGTAMLLYTGAGAASAILILVLVGLVLLVMMQFKRKGESIMNDDQAWAETENPAFEF